MASSGYLTVESAGQGLIEGSVTTTGHEGTIEVLGWSMEASLPLDVSSGRPTGSHVYRPLVITKPVDKASPLLFQAMARSETLDMVVLDLYGQSQDGQNELQYSIELSNARVAGIRGEQLDNGYAENVDQPRREYLSIVFLDITVTWHPDSVSASDSAGS